jgi:hypothetical protein
MVTENNLAIGLNTHGGTPAFQQKNISPNSGQLAKPLPSSDFSESAGLVQRNAGNVLRKHASLQRPYPEVFRLLDQRVQQHLANPATSCN